VNYLALQPIRIRIDDEMLLRSEILGKAYVYDVMEQLYFAASRLEFLPSILEKKFDKREDWQMTVKKIINLLWKINALYENGNLTSEGKLWFNLLEELNMLPSARPLEILKEDIPGYFLKNCLLPNLEMIDRIVIVSPWISPPSNQNILFNQICKKIKEKRIKTLVITRYPEKTWHEDALMLLKKSGAEVYVNEDIHAKLMICNMADRRRSVAIIGSANLTKGARFDNIEVGILIRGITDRYYSLVRDLISSAYDLKKVRWAEK
jgi:hypothetical protein